MAIYRPGVGRIVTGKGGWERRYSTEDAKPHPGYDEVTGLAKEAEVAQRTELPGGLVIESYGAHKGSSRPPRVAMPSPLPEIDPSPATPPPSAKDWRDSYGLLRGG